jgi:hypothetical protein
MSTFRIVTAKELRPRDLILETRITGFGYEDQVPMFKIERPDPQKMYAVQPLPQLIDQAAGALTKKLDEMVRDYLDRGGDPNKLEIKVLPSISSFSGHEIRLVGMERA